jgi:ATP-dependent DNA helicase Rep
MTARPTPNPQQLEAIHELERPLLVLAGAGSGKTRVITEKIAHLVKQGIPARHITAVTFTNKAAREMRSRIGQIMPDRDLRGLRLSTFHALGLDLVRREHKALGYKPAISIFDEHDRELLIKELIKHGRKEYDIEKIDQYAHCIGTWKNLFVLPEQAEQQAVAADDRIAAELYAAYGRQIKAYNAVDFDDLILQPVLLLQNHPELAEKWQNATRYLLVDEYQDTNITQYRLLKLLTGKLGRFTVVGDDDQSIYAWRGAQPENLVQLQKDFPRLRVIKLEQNYRSTGRILKIANQLIANNPHIFEKQLWSSLGLGEKPRVIKAKDDVGESRQVASDIIHHKFRHAGSYSDYAILYRGNHQSRLFERALREHGIPYFISGGSSFFSHAEVKDVMAYLRLLVNPDDDAAYLRVVNVPRREIGPTTLEKLGHYAQQRQVSLFNASLELGLQQQLPEPALQRLQQFARMITEVAGQTLGSDGFGAIEQFVERIGYELWLREHSSSEQQAERRMGNVRELLDWLRRLAGEDQAKSLSEVVNKIMLLDILDRQEEENSGDRVNLMTLHSAKGLEFPFVYLVGMEENLLPHQTSIEDNAIEEERRLAYVGITRARRELTLSYCSHRKRYGELVRCQPSRFLHELPEEELEWPDKNPLPPEIKKERGLASLDQIRSLLRG